MPQSTIELIERRMIKVNRKIRQRFPDKAILEKHLREKIDADKNGNLSVDEFKVFI